MRQKKSKLVLLLATILFFVIGGPRWIIFHTLFCGLTRREDQLKSSANARPAIKSLALLCQSDPFFFVDESAFAPAWTPPEILTFHPTWVNIKADCAHIEFGGGFHHFGYDLALDKAASTQTQNAWKLDFYSEDSTTRTVATCVLNKADQVATNEFIKSAMPEFQRRASLQGSQERTVAERIAFLLKFDRVDAAKQSIRECAAAYTTDWPDQLLAYLIGNDPAVSRLESWAAQKNDFSAWLLAAYACGLSDNAVVANRFSNNALRHPVDEPAWLSYNASFRGATVCAQLVRLKQYKTCQQLCDALLTYSDNNNNRRSTNTLIKDSAVQASSKAISPNIPEFAEGTEFTPFKGIDLSRLTQPAATTAHASTRQALSKDDRLLRYFNSQIAANPGGRSYYTRKIALPLTFNRPESAFNTCRAASHAFPDWRRPATTLLFLTGNINFKYDPGSSGPDWTFEGRR